MRSLLCHAVRLNLNVAAAAAAAGGCVIVDATKRGKVRCLLFFQSHCHAQARNVGWFGRGQAFRQLPLAAACPLQRFPDAMSKTIPMWAAVMNRAVARLRGLGSGGAAAAAVGRNAAAGAATEGGAAAACAAAAAAAAAAGEPWDCDVHLPPWVSEVEANSIRQRLEGWTDQLLEVSMDVGWAHPGWLARGAKL